MPDQFKEFVEDNRPEFERYREDYQALWEGIEERLPVHNDGKLIQRNFFWKAAVVFLLAVSGLLALKVSNQKNELPIELAEAASHYSPLINEKMEVLQVHKLEIGSQVLADLEILDEAFDELRRDLGDDANNQEVVEAMIQNYRIKLDVLEQILEEIQNKEHEQNNQESTHL